MRGQPEATTLAHSSFRIIPARAGPTIGHVQRIVLGADHPRSCGANYCLSLGTLHKGGSSPLVRGQPGGAATVLNLERIIPARAGPTARLKNSIPQHEDHPRSCGANVFHGFSFLPAFGSSPLVRGQLTGIPEQEYSRRIIPARAGPTKRFRPKSSKNADHPRSCGANWTGECMSRALGGSSPLVRGQQSDFTRKKRVESNKNI